MYSEDYYRQYSSPGSAKPSSWKCRFKRIGYMMSAFSYTGVVYTAIQIAFSSGEYDDTIEDLANELFDLPIGEWGIFLGGIVATTVGIFLCLWSLYRLLY